MHTWLALLLLLAPQTPRTVADMAKESAAKAPDETPIQAPRPPRGRVTLVESETVQSGAPFEGMLMSRLVLTRSTALRACYERQLRTAPAPFGGRMVVGLTITPAGSVIGVHVVSNATGNVDTAACAQRIIQGFRFSPGPEGEVNFTLTLDFQPE